jgi:hypothetical protein
MCTSYGCGISNLGVYENAADKEVSSRCCIGGSSAEFISFADVAGSRCGICKCNIRGKSQSVESEHEDRSGVVALLYNEDGIAPKSRDGVVYVFVFFPEGGDFFGIKITYKYK